ncbi:GTP 3',8-cyclase MoaA [Formicincola oecophyllae]|uniref:GTP 3',8-cyclase n=1 Tax=Formicincola oecophyllae TaxID=2558361 RepID=A0A4Y6UB30_9PROT|nr:GTP 3',8-cyclase MoaA [Formicincola oecophyllae]QDH13666.1 GTP 3',8-cyclase MoaA [Formicincola oecophyllae]
MNAAPPVLDQLGRPLRDLRISVMDRCNLRCPYCMPEEKFGPSYRFLPPAERLDFDEVTRLARLAVSLGVSKIRLTGGEPLLRPHLPQLVGRLAVLEGVRDLALTTNGVLLARQAKALRQAGLSRVTVSLDALDDGVFAAMSGHRGAAATVVAGLEAALEAGFPGGVKLNSVVRRGVNEGEVVKLARWGRDHGVPVRFIEYMDAGTRNGWNRAEVVPALEIKRLAEQLGPLEPLVPAYRGEVARRWRYKDGQGEIGLISSVTQPFCSGCTRMRLSSDGKLYGCLFATKGVDVRALLRAPTPATDEAIVAVLARFWGARTDRYSELRGQGRAQDPQTADGVAAPGRIEMNYIGG